MRPAETGHLPASRGLFTILRQGVGKGLIRAPAASLTANAALLEAQTIMSAQKRWPPTP